MPRPSCLRLFWQLMRRAASRAACTAGKSSATNTPMMAITTSSSTSVNAGRRELEPVGDIPSLLSFSALHQGQRVGQLGCVFAGGIGRRTIDPRCKIEVYLDANIPERQRHAAVAWDQRVRETWSTLHCHPAGSQDRLLHGEVVGEGEAELLLAAEDLRH